MTKRTANSLLGQECRARFGIIGLIILLSATSAQAGPVLRCQDEKGRWTFTDDERRCPKLGGQAERAPEVYDVKLHNMHSQFGSLVSEEYYNYAYRAYAPVPGYSLNIIAEQKLIDSDPKQLDQAARKLEQATATAMATLPWGIQKQFAGVKYFFFTGDESRTGGRKGGQWYFRKGNSTSPRFDDSVVIRSVKDYLNNYSEARAAQTALHELSHAYYYYHWRKIYQDLKAAYENAHANKLYLNVKNESGRVLTRAYAISDPREYFAELAKIYHLGNHYYPFNREELRNYDPLGYEMIEKAFRYRN